MKNWEHFIGTQPTAFESKSGDNRRILMKSPTVVAATQPTTNYYQAQVLNLDEYGRLRLGARNVAANYPNIFYTAIGTYNVTSPNWNSAPWNFIGCGIGIIAYGGWQIPHDGYYEIEMAGHGYCPSAILSFGSACRVDQGTTIIYDPVGDSYTSAVAAAGVNHITIRYNNTMLLTPSLYTGGYCNVYPAFIGTTSPAAQNIFIDQLHFTVRMLSSNKTY